MKFQNETIKKSGNTDASEFPTPLYYFKEVKKNVQEFI